LPKLRMCAALPSIALAMMAANIPVHAVGSALVPSASLTRVVVLGVTTGSTPAYVATPGGLFRSADSTFNRWEQENQVKGITFVSPNPQVSNDLVYATDNGIFRSLDGGRTVTKTSGCKLSSLVRAPSTPSVVYATTLAYKDCPFITGTALYQAIIRSTDDGRSWTLYHQLNDQYEQGTWLGPLAVDPANVGHVVVAENLYERKDSRTIQTLGVGKPWTQGQSAPIGHGQPLAIAFDPVRPNRLWVSWAFGCQGGLYLNGSAVGPGFFTEVAEGYFTDKAPGALAFDPVSGRLYIAGLTCRQRVYDGPTQIYTVDASTGTYLTVGKSIPNPGAQAPYLAVTGNGYLLTGGPKTPLTVLKLNGPGIWRRASYLPASAGLLGSPISPPTVCQGSPCQYFEKGALLKGGSPLPLDGDLLTSTAASSLPVGGTTSTITYADLAKLENKRTPSPAGFQHGVSVGPTGTFVPFSAQLSAKPGYIVPSFFWRFLTNARSVPGGWLRDIGLPLTSAVQATVTKGALGKRTITIQAFQYAILTYDPLNPSASRVERANIGSDYATAFPKATR
jgi:hypothetical protein